MPKVRTPQPKGTGRIPGAVARLEPEPLSEGVFTVRVTDAQKASVLEPGDRLRVRTEKGGVALCSLSAVVGYLERDGELWVSRHRVLSCIFVDHGPAPNKTFLVRLAGRPR